MELKKKSKADLTRNSGLYFVIGLAFILAVTWGTLEYKKYDKDEKFDYTLNVDDDLDEEVPMTEQLNTPPPPVAPEVIEVVKDDKDVVETPIPPTEPEPEVIEKVEDIAEVEDDLDVDVPFAVIEDVPVYPGCEGLSKYELKDCFQQKIQEHIRDNFRYPEIAQELGIQGRVSVMFIIQKDGSIGDIRMRGPDKNLEKEAMRIIQKLPKMTPGKQRGRPVRVPFSIPINFKLQ